MAGLVAIVKVVQLGLRSYVLVLYWLAVMLVRIVGTLITDNITDALQIALELTTAVFGAALIAVFVIWYGIERTLSIHSINTLRREVFHWLAIQFTSALGTASGDLIAEQYFRRAHLCHRRSALRDEPRWRGGVLDRRCPHQAAGRVGRRPAGPRSRQWGTATGGDGDFGCLHGDYRRTGRLPELLEARPHTVINRTGAPPGSATTPRPNRSWPPKGAESCPCRRDPGGLAVHGFRVTRGAGATRSQ
jgi:hypothetical protein